MPTCTARLDEKLRGARNALLIGVGGGNDSVTTLLLREQLRQAHGFTPERLDVAAMLPDFLEYRRYAPTDWHPSLWRVRPDSERWFQGTRVLGFPEPLLAGAAERFGIGAVYGVDMSRGTAGVCGAFRDLIAANSYDLVLACDIGGDFIAAPENYEVLSPMMDAYALHALRQLDVPGAQTRFVYAVFGLGTDGESSPEMLRRALQNVGEYEGRHFDAGVAPDVERFYREEVEPNRYSRTADFTLREIRGVEAEMHRPVERYRVRLHTRPTPTRRRSYTGAFEHQLDPEFYGRYYLFDRLDGIRNPFCVPCADAGSWCLQVSSGETRAHHELVGQSVTDEGGRAVNYAIVSRKFGERDREAILRDTVSALRTGVYDAAYVYREDALAYRSVLDSEPQVPQEPVGNGLLRLSRPAAS